MLNIFYLFRCWVLPIPLFALSFIGVYVKRYQTVLKPFIGG